MRRRSIIIAQALLFVIVTCAYSQGSDAPYLIYSVQPSNEWSNLFLQTNGWTGADGIFSLPMNGVETKASANYPNTFFWFGDTYIGQMEYTCRHFQRAGEVAILRNTGAYLLGTEPDRQAISFFCGYDAGEFDAMVVPDTIQATSDSWYWFGDGLLLGQYIYIFAYRFVPNPFAYDGVVLIRFSRILDPPMEHSDFAQFETPLFQSESSNGYPVVFGAGVFANTTEAGVPDPDEYIYVYGIEDNPKDRNLFVARTPKDQFVIPSAWRFWDGGGWTTDIASAAPVASHVSNELSVSPIRSSGGNVYYVLIYQHNGTSPYIAARLSAFPFTGFSTAVPIYKCPERETDPTGKIFTYNAKAHPHLSDPGTLLISYNVNTFNDTGEFMEYGEIYHPRFIKVTYILREDVDEGPSDELDDFLASNPLQDATIGLDEQGRRVWRVDLTYFGDETEPPFVEDPTCIDAETEIQETANLTEANDASTGNDGGKSPCFISTVCNPGM